MRNRAWRALLCLGGAGLTWSRVAAQTGAPPAAQAAETVTAGVRYGAGWLHRLLLGAHYRDLWTTPVRVAVLDLGRFAGGLTPLRRGGGRETKSLRLQGANGRVYAFRSVDKDPTAALPPDLRQTFITGVVQDQISSSHPAGALVVAPLLDAAGVLNAAPHLFVMPDDPRLGAFRPEFGGMLGQLEERPPKDPEDEPEFGGATRVVTTAKLWEYLDRGPENRVDARAFLAARLLDLFVGDWDRHAAQWRWARLDEGDARLWRPIPRDRDQAFSKLDGLLPWLAHFYFLDLVGFGPDYPNMIGLTWDGRVLDRRLLVDLERPVWDSLAGRLQQRLTDSVIDAAVRRLPPEYYTRNGAELAQALKRRRDRLPDAARRFYELLARVVDLHGTRQPELVEVERGAEGTVAVRIATRDQGSTVPHAPYYHRTFHPGETEEVRLYLGGGGTRVVARGHGSGQIVVRVIAGSGADELVDSSAAGARFYDASASARVVRGARTAVDHHRDPFPPPTDPAQDPLRDWGAQTVPMVRVAYATDYGAVLGVGATVTHFGFRADPYTSRQTVSLSFATAVQRPRVEYRGEFPGLARGLEGDVAARASWIDVVRFYGFGNETRAPRPDAYYKVQQADYLFAPALVLAFSRRAQFAFGPRLEAAQTTLAAGTLLDSLRPYGTGHFGQVGAEAEFRADARNQERAASSGLLFVVGGSAYPATWDVARPFEEAHAEVATYLTAPIPTGPTLALRAVGKKLWGAYPFHEAAFVGGATTVRGFPEHRFAGDAALIGNAELRLSLFRFSLLAPDEFGVFGLGDVGRVYLSGETSDRWHAAAGGGIWVSFLHRSNTLSLAYARSPESSGFYLRAGFLY